MYDNKRKNIRRSLTYEAAIVASDGAWRHECTVLDVSESGAQLSVNPAILLPGAFVLSLTKDGTVSRPCCLVWRKDGKVGVRFTSPARDANPSMA